MLALLAQSLYAQQSNVLANLEQEIQNLIESVKPSVVTIKAQMSYSYSETTGSNLFGIWGTKEEKQTVEYTNVGTGIILNKEGLILTKASIVANSQNISVTFCDDKQSPAQYLGR